MAALAPRPGSGTSHLTWSNALTALRLFAAPFFFCSLLGRADWLAFGLFWLAVATDVADGRLARARGEASAFGGLLDHATDASFVCLGLSALAVLGIVPIALPALVLLAFVQYVLDSKSLKGRALRASLLGRWNGILYFVPLGIVTAREAFGLGFPADTAVHGIGIALIISTIVSMLDRAWTLRNVRQGRVERS